MATKKTLDNLAADSLALELMVDLERYRNKMLDKGIDLETDSRYQKMLDDLVVKLKKEDPEFIKKLDATIWVMKRLENESDLFEERERFFASKKRRHRKDAERIKNKLCTHLQKMGLVNNDEDNKKELTTNHHVLALRKGTDVVECVDRETVPDEFKRFKDWELKKDDVKKIFKAGGSVDGCVYKENEPTLNIKKARASTEEQED